MNINHGSPEDFPQEVAGSAAELSESGNEGNDCDNRLRELKEAILDRWNQCDQLYLEIGDSLLEAKKLFGKHGKWLDWLKKNFPFSKRQAQRFMRVAAWFKKAKPGSNLDFSKAYILTRIPPNRVEDFLRSYMKAGVEEDPFSVIQDISKRELERAIREYLLSSGSARHTRREEKSEVVSSMASSEDSALNTLCQLENTMFDLVESIINQRVDEEEYDTLISGIRELCEDTLGKLPSEDAEL